MFKLTKKQWLLVGGGLTLVGLIIAIGVWVLLANAHDQEWGTPLKEQRVVNGISKLEFSGIGDITIVQGDEERLEIAGPADALPRVESRVQKGTLYLTFQSLNWWNPVNWFRRAKPPIQYTLYLKNLDAIRLKGSSQVLVSTLTTKQLSIDLEGASLVQVASLQAEVVRVEIAGVGRVKLAGVVEKQNIIVTGSATYQADGLQSKETYIQVSGEAQLEVRASGLIDVEISGSGQVEYAGDPKNVRQRISGTGSLVKK